MVREDNTLMGRLATRMVARDFIDKQNLGLGTKASKAATANTAMAPPTKVETGKFEIPTKMNISGPAKHEAKEHKLPIEQGKKIAEDHLRKDPSFYDKMKKCGM